MEWQIQRQYIYIYICIPQCLGTKGHRKLFKNLGSLSNGLLRVNLEQS